MLNALRRISQRARLVRSLYDRLNSQARRPAFFKDLGVADSFDGRFDMVALHAWLALERLRADRFSELARGLTDLIFIGFDEALRDLGAGDMGMGRKIKKMGDAFNGRLAAYGSARDEAELGAAILRNVYRGDEARADDALNLARYAFGARAALARCDPSKGELDFGPLPKPVDQR